MKTNKTVVKILAVALASIMAFSAFSATLFTASAASVLAEGLCGDNVKWALDSDGILTVSGTGDMYDIASGPLFPETNSSPWNKYVQAVRTVVIDTGVTGIGDYTFCFCKNLYRLLIADTVKTIGDHAFEGCDVLTDASIAPGSRLKTIGTYAFKGCSSMSEFDIPEGVTEIGDFAFYFSGVEYLLIPKTVKTIGTGALAACGALKGNMGYIGACKAIVAADDSPYFKSEDGALYTKDMSVLIAVPTAVEERFAVPDSVSKIVYGAFSVCTKLYEISMTDSVLVIENGTFGYCTNLRKIKLPYHITKIDDNMFKGCENLQEITFSKSVKTIGVNAFDGCVKLGKVYYEGDRNDKANIVFGGNNQSLLDAEWIYETVIRHVINVNIKDFPKTRYRYGQAFNKSGMTIEVTYSDGTTVPVTDPNAIRVSGYNSKIPGIQPLSVTYDGFTITMNVTVLTIFLSVLDFLFGWIFRIFKK
ncbi:MAG: leucine-rich repeat protein [Clostridiales bacterium]|nr:leucine-rich repeat protein [Clostridiales bacterium]